MPALAQVIGASVHDYGAPEHALRADQLDLAVGDGALGVALRVGLEVPEVADVAVVVGRRAVLFGIRVDWEFLATEGVGCLAFFLPLLLFFRGRMV